MLQPLYLYLFVVHPKTLPVIPQTHALPIPFLWSLYSDAITKNWDAIACDKDKTKTKARGFRVWQKGREGGGGKKSPFLAPVNCCCKNTTRKKKINWIGKNRWSWSVIIPMRWCGEEVYIMVLHCTSWYADGWAGTSLPHFFRVFLCHAAISVLDPRIGSVYPSMDGWTGNTHLHLNRHTCFNFSAIHAVYVLILAFFLCHNEKFCPLMFQVSLSWHFQIPFRGAWMILKLYIHFL